MTAGRHERIHYWSQFVGPFRAGRENNRTGTGDGPIARLARSIAFLRQPAMPKNFEVKAGRVIQVCFKGDGFLFLAKHRKQPLDR